MKMEGRTLYAQEDGVCPFKDPLMRKLRLLIRPEFFADFLQAYSAATAHVLIRGRETDT
jgi:hypothetical protein